MKRLDKFIACNTSLSRKETKIAIIKKVVQVNDCIITDAGFKISDTDIVKINNEIITDQQHIYIALYKPKNYLSSTQNSKKYKSVLNLINNLPKNLHLIGRLDVDTTGLLLLTTDGNFTHQIKSKKYLIEKEYAVTLTSNFTDEMLNKLSQTIYMDNKKLQSFKITNIDKNNLNITLTEGKYHQVKRLFKLVNNEVVNLKRVRIGKLKLDLLQLNPTEYKFIKPSDVI